MVRAVLGHLGVGLGADNTLRLVIGALSALGNIWVIRLGLERVSLGVTNGKSTETTIASHLWKIIAVYELRLGEGNEISGGDEVSTFEGTSGREGPARSTLSLVLDWGDGSCSDPVDIISELSSLEVNLIESFEVL